MAGALRLDVPLTSAPRRAALRVAAAIAACQLAAAPSRAQTCDYIVEGTRWLWHADPPPVAWADAATPDDP